MTAITMLAGLALIAIGIGFKVGTGTESYTALIPAIPGVLMLLCGIFAIVTKRRSLFIHIALVLALLSGLAFAMRVPKTIGDDGKASVLAALLMSILVCGGYIALGVRSFRAARRRRKLEKADA